MADLTDDEIRHMASFEPVHPYPSDRRILVDECLRLRAELKKAVALLEDAIDSCDDWTLAAECDAFLAKHKEKPNA